MNYTEGSRRWRVDVYKGFDVRNNGTASSCHFDTEVAALRYAADIILEAYKVDVVCETLKWIDRIICKMSNTL